MSAPSHDARETAALLDFGALVAALKRAAIELDEGGIVCPDRSVVAMADDVVLMSMPCVAPDVAIHKLITVAPRNRERGLATIHGTVTVFDPHTGRVRMTLDGPTVTGRRTAAVSMLALGLLRAEPPDGILLVGTGTQARHHLEAIAALYPQARVRVRGTSLASMERFCAESRDVSVDLAPATGEETPSVVVTCTTSRVPVHAAAASADRLLIAVGVFQRDAAEIAAATVRGSAIFVDDPRGARHEAGDLIQAAVDWSGVGSLAGLLREHAPRPEGPVLFKSVGCAAWDLAAARVAQGIGAAR